MKRNKVKYIICMAAVMLATVMPYKPVYAQEEEVETVVVEPEVCVNFQVKDNDGKLLNSVDMELLDAEGEEVVSWDGNKYVGWSYDITKSDYFSRNWADIFKVDGQIKYVAISSEYITEDAALSSYVKATPDKKFYYGSEESYVRFKYIPVVNAEEVALTLPANKILIAADDCYEGWKYRPGISIFDNNDKSTSYYFDELAGQEVMYDWQSGKYEMWHRIGDSSGSGSYITVYDAPTQYIKVQINLKEQCSAFFKEDGTMVISSLGNNYTVDFKTCGDAAGLLYITSGAVVNAVAPDENGNVTIYLEASTYEARYSTNYVWTNGGGGGTNGSNVNTIPNMPSCIYKYNVMSVPEKGVTLVGLEPGQYTLRQSRKLEGYVKPQDVVFTIEADSSMDSFVMVNQKQTGIYQEEDGKYYYFVDGELQKSIRTFIFDKDEWYYIKYGRWNNEFTGLVYIDGRAFYTVNGKMHNVTGLALIFDEWYFLSNGQVHNTYTGLALFDNEWFRVENGIFTSDFNGIQEYDGADFLISSGKIRHDYSGLYQKEDGNWCYVANGQIQKQYTGFVQYDGTWFYLVDGVIASGLSGIFEYDNAYFLLGTDGRMIQDYRGLYQNTDGKWYYVADGQVQTQYTGIVQYDGVWFYVENGMFNESFSGWVEYDGSGFLISNGMVVGQ